MSTPATNFNEREHVICQVARLVEDKFIYWVGGGGEPLSTVLLAKRTHAPNLVVMFEAGGVAPILPSMRSSFRIPFPRGSTSTRP